MINQSMKRLGLAFFFFGALEDDASVEIFRFPGPELELADTFFVSGTSLFTRSFKISSWIGGKGK